MHRGLVYCLVVTMLAVFPAALRAQGLSPASVSESAAAVPDQVGAEIKVLPARSLPAVDYTAPVGNHINGLIHLDANTRTKQWYNAFNGQYGNGNIGQAGYNLLNGRAALSSDGYEFALWVKNMLDEQYTSYAINIQSAWGMDYLLPGPPEPSAPPSPIPSDVGKGRFSPGNCDFRLQAGSSLSPTDSVRSTVA